MNTSHKDVLQTLRQLGESLHILSRTLMKACPTIAFLALMVSFYQVRAESSSVDGFNRGIADFAEPELDFEL